MSPASYRTAPPRVAESTLPGGEPQAKSWRRDVQHAATAPGPAGPDAVGPSSYYCPADGDGDAEGDPEGEGAGLAAGAVAGIFASASIAFFSAAETFFCASPYAAKSPAASAVWPAWIAEFASSNAAFSWALASASAGVAGADGPAGVCPLLAESPAAAPESPPKSCLRAASRVGAKPTLSPKATSTRCSVGYDVSPVDLR